MIPAYKIIKKEGDSLIIEIKINEDLIYFNGHFTDFPILPAVAQLFIAEQITSKELNIIHSFANMKRVKFKSPIKPNTTLILYLTYNSELAYLDFCYRDDKDNIFSLGKMYK